MFHFVDDNVDFLKFIEGVASVKGIPCRTFDSPLKYLEYIQSDAYEVPVALFSDVCMPEMSGFEMLRRVRALLPGLRVAVISGYNDEQSEDHYCLYLQKPIRLGTLQRAFEVFARCHAQGPDDSTMGCREADDRDAFQIDCWNCPLVAGRRQSG